MDLAKLAEQWWLAWEAGGETASGLDRHGGVIGLRMVEVDKSVALDADHAAFIALAQNALAVMMRRAWWPSYEEDGWHLDDLCATDECAELGEWAKAHSAADPFTALIEADRWAREHLDKPAP